MNYIAMASSEAGLVKQTNQDSYFAQVVSGARGKLAFAVVCDGMGGLEKGEVASASVVQAFRRWVEERLPLMDQDEIDDQSIRSEWTEIAVSFNEKLKRYGRENQLRLGTTLTALLLTDQRYYCMNIGDTRAYELTDRLTQITEDHTVIAREVELGNLTEEEARTDPRRSVLLQCIGASEEIFPDLFFGEARRNAVYLLCSDGFRHEITGDEIYRYLRAEMCLSAAGMKQSLDALIRMNMERMETDNITAVAIRTY
ncbi:PrpC [Lachnospiraceae bacterium]|nr:PrpC [Lachnospiraceae bacterium]